MVMKEVEVSVVAAVVVVVIVVVVEVLVELERLSGNFGNGLSYVRPTASVVCSAVYYCLFLRSFSGAGSGC